MLLNRTIENPPGLCVLQCQTLAESHNMVSSTDDRLLSQMQRLRLEGAIIFESFTLASIGL